MVNKYLDIQIKENLSHRFRQTGFLLLWKTGASISSVITVVRVVVVFSGVVSTARGLPLLEQVHALASANKSGVVMS